MKIYTRTGDAGETSLFDGTRVRKDDARVDAYGEVDELNACLGLARSSLGDRELDDEIVDLDRIQRDLFALGARLADPADKIADRVTKAAITDADVARLETLIDPLRARAAAAAPVHSRRRQLRAARRCTWRAPSAAAPNAGWSRCSRRSNRSLLRYVNRLSDLLFVAARAGQQAGGRRGDRVEGRPSASVFVNLVI